MYSEEDKSNVFMFAGLSKICHKIHIDPWIFVFSTCESVFLMILPNYSDPILGSLLNNFR